MVPGNSPIRYTTCSFVTQSSFRVWQCTMCWSVPSLVYLVIVSVTVLTNLPIRVLVMVFPSCSVLHCHAKRGIVSAQARSRSASHRCLPCPCKASLRRVAARMPLLLYLLLDGGSSLIRFRILYMVPQFPALRHNGNFLPHPLSSQVAGSFLCYHGHDKA